MVIYLVIHTENQNFIRKNHEVFLHMFLLKYNQNIKDKWVEDQI